LVQVDENTKFMVSPDCRKQMVKNWGWKHQHQPYQ
jgi:hypothetical protein